jgi:hypothetical protein
MTAPLDSASRSRLAADIESLWTEFAGVFSLETIEQCLAESLEQFADARVQTFVSLFVRRCACEHLRSLAQTGRSNTDPAAAVTDRSVQGCLSEFKTST